jgi:hypothetical protein
MTQKTYLGISRDHSGSLSHLASAAMRDYNQTITAIRNSAAVTGQSTIVSVIKCGVGAGGVHQELRQTPIENIGPLTHYEPPPTVRFRW